MLTRKFSLEVPRPRPGDNLADTERCLAALPFKDVETTLSALRHLPETLRRGNWRVTVTLGARTGGGWRLLAVEPGDTTASHWGVALDGGTTTLAASLVDLKTGEVKVTSSGLNRQIEVAEDLLTRLQLSGEPEGRERLIRLFRESVNWLLQELAFQAAISSQEITALAFSGNTAMTHFFLGLDPSRLCQEPYLPVVNRPGYHRNNEGLHLALHPEAVIYCLPSVGSYLGGDALAGILVSGIHRQEAVSLLVDIGTNAEIVLGNREWLIAAAGAAGPALEGGVMAAGMRAAPGVIERIRVDPITGAIDYHPPKGKVKGLCGSAVVDLLAGLLLAGIIDRAGRFTGERDYLEIVPASATATGEPLILSQQDVKNFIRTKGAVTAAVETLMGAVGIRPQELEYFLVAGAFGEHMDVEAAVTLGLYPDLPRERLLALGNTSLAGARLALLAQEARQELEDLSQRITYVELNASKEFMDRFTGGQFFPHTDLSLYPTVRQRLLTLGLLKE
ncbi:ASKHA domain-containing protein [Desulfothermobacter acidiphilus]|uniref:ASKHA domain-containing protein n=1 Tax=Desulfothermobacter acidiphilus TaxID=1938353 RepID=UPI003F8A236A